ncbi:MAG TPA: hypothetical protein VIW80_22380 [Pyrinomonadaceae bacterium]|jgi:hypothetical protein
MKSIRPIYNLIAIVVITITASSFAHAQATRTWVSGVGDDANPCSRTAPCKTFAGAISRTANGGEIDALDPGGFGTVTITKNITIDGEGTMASILAAGTNGVNVNDSATATPNTIVVNLRNLSINGATTGLVGVNITAGRNVNIENCVIFGFRSGNGNGVRDARTVSTNPAGQLWITNTSFYNNSGSAVNVIGAAAAQLRAFLNNVRINGNSSHGVQVQNGSTAHIRESAINGNLGDGVRAETAAKVNIISSMLNGNLTGVNNVAGTVNLADVTMMNNANGVAGVAVVSFGNNNVRDNGGGNTLPAAVGQQ